MFGARQRNETGIFMLIEILCTGDEILTGKTVNTNYSHMARRFGEVGLTMHWSTCLLYTSDAADE